MTELVNFTPQGIGFRLLATCWLVFSLHFATNVVRESYLALAIGDHLSFRVDEYANLHDDIFEKPGYGWHIGSNPGASMLAAIPYVAARPIIDAVVERVREERQARGDSRPPSYDAPAETDRIFYERAWSRGLDVKFGLGSFVMQSFAMAVISALGVVVMFTLLRQLTGSVPVAVGLALLYAFGTPVFFRTGLLNHNMMMGHVALAGFVTLWNPGSSERWSTRKRCFLAGLAGGASLLLDYSGVILLAGLLAYGLVRSGLRDRRGAVRLIRSYALGALGPIVLLWFYQWQSFGHPFFPGQHWMPPVEWSDQGYQGLTWPQPRLALALALDYRYGILASCPLFLLALAAPLVGRRRRGDGPRDDRRRVEVDSGSRAPLVPRRELFMCLAFFVALWLFFSGVHYTRWQFNTGIRYLAPAFPFLFLLATTVLVRLPRVAGRVIGVLAIAQAWCMAMSRDVSGGKVDLLDPDAGLGVLDPILSVMTEGFQLPALTTLSRMEGYGDLAAAAGGVSPLAMFAIVAAVLAVIWVPPGRRT